MSGPIRAYPARRRGFFARWAADDPGPVGAYPVRQRRPSRMRRYRGLPRWVGGLVVLLVVVLALTSAAAVDTVVRLRLQSQIAAVLNESLTCSPQVSVRGLSAIWQIRQQRFADIRARCDRASLPGSQGDQVAFTDLQLEGRDIRGTGSIDQAVMGSATISAVLPYDQASTMLGSTIKWGGDGRIAATRAVEVAGAAVPVTITAVLAVSDGKIVLIDPKASAAGVPIPALVVDQLTKQILQRAEIPTVASMTLSSVVALESGLLVTMHGTEVSLRDLQ